MKYWLITFCILSSILLSCSPKKGESSPKNTLRLSLSGEVSTLDPANSYDTISASVVYQGYEQLYEYHYLKRPYTLQPLLAESMPKISEDGKVYEIKIKKNILYHDDPAFNGKPRFLKAQDFVTQIKRLAFKPTNSNGWWLFDRKIVGLNEFRNKAKSDFSKFKSLEIEGLQTPDDHTLIIKLKDPYPQMLFALALSFTSPIPIEAVEKYDNILNTRIIGTGPYKLIKYNQLSGINLKRFEKYREAHYPGEGDRLANNRGLLKDAGKTIPFIENITYRIIKESSTRWLNFGSNKIDLLANIPKDNFNAAIDKFGKLNKELYKQGKRLQTFPTLTYWWLSFNMKDPIVGKNKNLRLAIAHALDIKRYIQVFTNNIGQKANSIYPPGIPGYDPSAKLPYKYDLALAKDFLKKAGYPGGKGLPILTYDVRGTSATNRQQAQFIKQELEKINIKVKVVTNTFPSFLQKSRNGQLQFWQDGWALDYPDAENVLQLLISKNHSPGPNATFYSNKKFDHLFSKMRLLNEGPEKHSLMKEMEKIINQDLPWIMEYYARSYILYHKRLLNFRHSNLIYNNIKYLRFE